MIYYSPVNYVFDTTGIVGVHNFAPPRDGSTYVFLNFTIPWTFALEVFVSWDLIRWFTCFQNTSNKCLFQTYTRYSVLRQPGQFLFPYPVVSSLSYTTETNVMAVKPHVTRCEKRLLSPRTYYYRVQYETLKPNRIHIDGVIKYYYFAPYRGVKPTAV